MIETAFWKEYHKARSFTTKAAWAQEAHEAIRPTDLSRTPESLKSDLDPQQLKLYTLIWKRTLASQMQEAIVEVTTYNFSPERASNQTWVSKWEVIKFDWFMKLYIEWTDDEEEEKDAEWMLPKISEWESATSKIYRSESRKKTWVRMNRSSIYLRSYYFNYYR